MRPRNGSVGRVVKLLVVLPNLGILLSGMDRWMDLLLPIWFCFLMAMLQWISVGTVVPLRLLSGEMLDISSY